MARFLPSVIEMTGYALLATAAFLVDVRLGIAAIGLSALYDVRGIKR